MFATKTTSLFLCFLLTAVILTDPSSSTSTDNYIYAVCSPSKFSSNSPYEKNLNSLRSSFISSTVLSRYTNFTFPSDVKPEPYVTVYGLYQCNGDLDSTACSTCVSRAIAQVGTLCSNSYSGFIQMDSCFIRYDNSSFLGVADKTVMLKKCGDAIGFDDQDALTRVSDVMSSLGSGGGPYRNGENGDVHGEAQCSGDLSQSQCQDCLSDAIGRLRSDCGMSKGGYVYSGKCYARFSYGGSHARQTPNPNLGGEKNNKEENKGIGKTLAIIIGIITLIILLIVFLAFLGKQCRKLQDEKWCRY